MPTSLEERIRADDELRLARESAGLTQRSAAALAKVDPQTISRWERGERTPSHGEREHLLSLYRDYLKGDKRSRQNVARGTSVSPADPTTPDQAIRRVRAIAARLEADLHEWGATTSTFDAMRIALATEDNVRMFRDGFTDRPGDIASVFRRYALFAEALRETLRDRVEKLAEAEEAE